MYKIPLKTQHQITESLTFSSINSVIKKMLEKFFQEDLFVKEYKEQSAGTYLKKASLIFTSGFESYIQNEGDISWENYCNLMQYIKSYNLEELSFGNCVKSYSRECVKNFYLFVIEKQLIEVEQHRLEFYISLLIDNDVAFYKKYAGDNLLNKRIRTNFPLNSNLEKIITVQEGTVKGNLFINCDDIFLYKTLKDFLLENIEFRNILQIRLFFYYFEESLGNITYKIESVSFFNSETFRLQYLFFKQTEINFHKKPAVSPVNYLVKFYLYIDQKYYENSGIRLFSAKNFNKELLIQSRYFTYIAQGYELLYKNSYEPIPSSDKWVLLYDEKTNSSQISKNNCMLDFTIIEDENERRDFKEFIWQQNISNKAVRDYFRVISKFLFTYSKYQIENIVYLGNSKRMSNDFLLKYRAVLEMRNTIYNEIVNYRTVNNELNILGKFLRHYKDKYKINDVSFQIFKANGKRFSGGNPIEPEEFKAISNEFRKNAINEETEMYFIIFQLTSSTKLRVGEVINLERDCIKNISEALGYGEIEYVSKSSYGEIVREILLLEDINLIKRAIELTGNLVSDVHEMKKKYIFLIKHGRKINFVIKLQNQYGQYFKHIIKSLKEQGLVHNDYVPYNARHTFIDNAWGALEDGLISDVEVLAVTGNSAQVASRHYRKYKTKKYVEATYMVSIGDVQIDGTILQDEQSIQQLPQVQRGIGGCNSKECIKDDSHDTDYKCLICKKFVTSIQRLELFEDKLKELQFLKSNAKSESMIEYYKVQEKLYGSYLARILALSEELTNDTVN